MIPENMQKPAAIWDWDGFGNSLELSVDANMQNMMGKNTIVRQVKQEQYRAQKGFSVITFGHYKRNA